ncbi:hypothetical protein J7F03_03065 [Streptomyces sp. ISL-43]|uniref:hypothetical protein n=1 Tax=Streptomyces sp. ISL-43 TaxID=2819183 RepID=UPI001BE97424|nr:hypothetical protein [Streptomyces sp. ISL-43]MBT2446085.1 hypothetical protein [Streptomyces sp. ISL-43]
MTPRLRIGDDECWVALTSPEEPAGPEEPTGSWRVTADWGGAFTADFAARGVDTEEVAAFADRLLARTGAAMPLSFWAEVSEGRGNPLRLSAIPAGDDDIAFVARLTPVGHDVTNHLDMEIGPVPLDGPRAELEEFRRDLV